MKVHQRDPYRYGISVYMPLSIAEKIMTLIEGKKVSRKTRACTHGKCKRKERSMRDMTIGDFLVSLADRKTRNIEPSEKAIDWGCRIFKRNLAKRHEADIRIEKARSWK